jgi:hypothetical protein
MTDKIVTKIFNYGDEKESEWPSQFGTGEKGVFHVKAGEVVEGYPENINLNFGTAPTVIFDSMPEQYHEGACRKIDSRKEWNKADQESGTLTFGNKAEATPRVDEANARKAKKAELRKASKAALDAYRANPREVRQKLEKQAEAQVKTLKQSRLVNKLKDAGVRYE